MTDTMRGRDWFAVALLSLVLGAALCLPTALGASGGARDNFYEPDSQPYALEGAGYAFDLYDLDDGVAVTVNGMRIGESAVSGYVASLRVARGLEDDGDWAAWLDEGGYDPESLRAAVIDYFATIELMRQAADDEGVSVSAEEIDMAMAQLGDEVDGSGGGGLAEGLDALGIDESLARVDVERRLLAARLAAAVAPAAEGGERGEFQARFAAYAADKPVTVEPMPKGLPYDVATLGDASGEAEGADGSSR